MKVRNPYVNNTNMMEGNLNVMSKYDERYEIRLAMLSDIEDIMNFINVHWREGHIMARDRRLFEYEYVDGDTVNFVIAIDKATQKIEGIFGFLKCSQTTDLKKKDIWGSIWKVVESHNNIPFLGIELAKRVFDLIILAKHVVPKKMVKNLF
jgi:hypothetical protein